MSVPDGVIAELEDIRDMVRRNLPRHRDPERFHEQKSEITGRLTKVLDALRTGRAIRA